MSMRNVVASRRKYDLARGLIRQKSQGEQLTRLSGPARETRSSCLLLKESASRQEWNTDFPRTAAFLNRLLLEFYNAAKQRMWSLSTSETPVAYAFAVCRL